MSKIFSREECSECGSLDFRIVSDKYCYLIRCAVCSNKLKYLSKPVDHRFLEGLTKHKGASNES